MSGESILPVAKTRPTDARSGNGMPAHKAYCPFCQTEGTVSISIQLCHHCGRWFEAEPTECYE